MSSALEAILVDVLKDLGGQAHVAEVRNRIREKGRHPPAEETLLGLGRRSPRIREVGPGRLALLAHLGEHEAASPRVPEDTETDAGLALGRLGTIRDRSYVCFDLETTGTDPASDAIIQVGALRVERGRVVGAFFEPVHPGDRVLPPALRWVLNIEPGGAMDRLIQAAAPWERVAPRFRDFVRDLPLVAHNACQLDLPFLREQGLDADHPIVDSLELAWLVLPHLERHDLESLAELMGYPEGCPEVAALIRPESRLLGVGHHNALYDAAVLHLVLERLLERLEEQLRDPYRGQIYRALLPDALGEQPGSLDHGLLRPLLTPRGFPDGSEAPTAGRIDSAEEDTVERSFLRFVRGSGRQWRQGQGEMVRLVARTLNEGNVRLIEAPTGTGKSLGLAFPAIQHALATGRRVLLSTHTRNLQAQLEGDLQKLSKEGDKAFRFAVLKGRGNYLCVRSLLNLAIEAAAADAEPTTLPTRYVLACLLGWGACQARDGREGSLDEFPFGLRQRFPTARRLIEAVRAERGRCDGQICRETAGCFRALARARAHAADVVVINHALWLSPALEDFPDFAGVLLDEAHELEDAATSAWTEEVTWTSLRTLLGELLDPGNQEGLLPRIVRRSRPAGPVREATRTPFAALRQARGEVVAFGRQLASFLANVGCDPRSEYGATCRLRAEGRREHPARWPALERAWRMLDASLAEVEDGLQSLAAAIDGEPEGAISEAEVVLLADRVREARRVLRTAFVRPDPAWVSWFSARTSPDDAKLERPDWGVHRAPVRVGERLVERFETCGGVVLTSATLSTRGGDFSFLLDRLGLASRLGPDRLHLLPGAFDGRNALFLIPRYLQHAPHGASLPFFTRELAEELEVLFRFTEGRGLGLFTARRRLEEVADHLERTLPPAGIKVLVQRAEAPKRRLLKGFRDDERSVLLGLKSFWQGVDVPGRPCSIVVLEKLPFPPFGDPVVDARREAVAAAGGSEFEDYLLPLGLLGVRQGFGRLLRDPEDRGAVLFMDRRIHHRAYKADLLRSLPGPSRAPETEASRQATYQAIAGHLPELFAGRDLPSLLAELPAELLSEVAREVERWDVPSPLDAAQYAELRPRLLDFLGKVFGHGGFRIAEQEEIVRAVLMGRDVLGLLPTGAGKSLTFQLPALLRRGLTLVVTPLIALMRDQVEKLRALRLEMVEALTSHQDAGEREDILRRAREGRIRLLYVSPERLRDPQLAAMLTACRLVQLVVDEAHCVSMWGPTFRPDYVGIAPAVRSLARRPPVVALTATATPEIRRDIERRLELRDPVVIRGDFDRPELRYIIYNARSRPFRIRNQNEKFRLAYLLARSAERRGEPMVIYTATTRRAEEVAGKLAALGLSARPYHGKMDPEDRTETQELFLDDHVRVVVATKAFGMGIDKPDIRHVVHYDVPGDLESYLQETGRAGRDGRSAWAVLLFVERDRGTQDYFIESLRMEPRQVAAILRELAPKVERSLPFDPESLAAEADVDELFLRVLLFRLEEAGYLRREPDVVTDAAMVLFAGPDEILSAWQADREGLPEDPQRVIAALEAVPVYRRTVLNLPLWAERVGVDSSALDRALVELAVRGLISYRPFGRSTRCSPGPHFSASCFVLGSDDPLIEGKRTKLEQMLAFARSEGRCRRESLLEYLGQPYRTPEGGCGGCDTCDAAADAPWQNERLADVPNPTLLFNPERVALELIDANVARAEEERRAPLGRQTLRAILLGNAYSILKAVREPYLRSWKDRRLRSFRQWGLLATLPGRGSAVDELLEGLVRKGWAEERQLSQGELTYRCLYPTEAGLRHLLSADNPR